MKKILLSFLIVASLAFGQTGSIFVDENHNGHRIFNIATPTVGSDVTNKTYVDSVASGGAPSNAHYVTTQSESGLSNEFSLGSLASGLLKQTVSSSVATPAIATAKTDYWDTTEVSTSGHGLAPQLPGDSTLFFNGVGQYIAIPGGGSGVSQIIAGGGVAWTGTGFNYIISAATYTINGVQYTSPQTSVTLSAADPSQDRIDVFYVNDSGTAGVITGTPGTPPVAPSVDPGSQLQLTFAYVVAASTTPGVTNVNIYLEDTEYTMSTNTGNINLASTNNPYAGTKCIEGTTTTNGNLFTAVKPSGTLDLSAYTQLTFQIRSKASWPGPKSISIFWMNGSTVVGASQALKQGTFGFDSSNTTSYQQIVIPIANFGTGTNPVDRLRMTISGGGSTIGWYIDNIILQAGGGGGGGGGTVTSFSAGSLSPLFTTSVTNPTTTPNLSFSLSTASANTHFANSTGSTAAPSFVSDAALTKTDDTNVTLTLGGTPTTALLHAASLTLGWTGQLSQARGGTGKDTSAATDGQLLIGKTSDHSLNLATLTQGTGITITNGAGTITIAATGGTQTHSVTFVMDGSGSVLTASTGSYIKIPYGGTLTGYTLIGSPSGSITIDIIRATDTNGLPSASIVGGGGTKPSLSSAVEAKSTSFSGWTSTTLNAFDNLAITTSGITSTTYVALTLYYQ